MLPGKDVVKAEPDAMRPYDAWADHMWPATAYLTENCLAYSARYSEGPQFELEQRAMRALEGGDYDEAEQLLAALLAEGSWWARQHEQWLEECRAWKAIKAGENEIAERLLIALLASGSHWAMGYQAWLEQRAWDAIESCKYEVAAGLLEPLAASGSGWAYESLGWMHQRGKLGPRNLDMAVTYFEAALRHGYRRSMYSLGRALKAKGDLQCARTVLLESAEQGDKRSMNAIVNMLLRGQDGATDREGGYTWLTRAATEGHAYAQRDLLRWELKRAPSLLDRVRIRGKLIGLFVSFARRLMKDPYSDDFG